MYLMYISCLVEGKDPVNPTVKGRLQWEVDAYCTSENLTSVHPETRNPENSGFIGFAAPRTTGLF